MTTVCTGIKVVGVCKPPLFPVVPTLFTQLSVEDTIALAPSQPNAESLVKLHVKATVDSTNVVSTPVGCSIQGQLLTGHKLVVEGTIHQRLIYIADTRKQPVHSTTKLTPFSAYIVVPEQFQEIASNANTSYTRAIVESVSVKVLDPRTFYHSVQLFVWTFNIPRDVKGICSHAGRAHTWIVKREL